MTEQMTFNIPVRRERRAGRPHHRTTTLTTTRKFFERLRDITDCEDIEIPFINDIISSAKGGASVFHHSIRRVSLLRRQLSGGFNKVKVRCEQGHEIQCFIVSDITGEEDDCEGKVWVSKRFSV